jgi:signal transduction histidine kinase
MQFYTTKENGTGIGLVLVQHIAQAHKKSVRLSNRPDGPHPASSVRPTQVRVVLSWPKVGIRLLGWFLEASSFGLPVPLQHRHRDDQIIFRYPFTPGIN